uniref:HAT C-terminal dimerisation domain-containing protein n=1 Tax=Meloidogyne floridensis TaxID=298350 RepID=A0A915NNJ1_9BILA
ATSQLLGKLSEDEQKNLSENFQQFYITSSEYVEKWFRFERYPTNIEWLSLPNRSIQHENVIELGKEYLPGNDLLFDEVSQLNLILDGIPDKEFERLSAEEKWQRIFKSTNMPGLYELVSKFLSVPASNAYVERVFSLISAQWTDFYSVPALYCKYLYHNM